MKDTYYKRSSPHLDPVFELGQNRHFMARHPHVQSPRSRHSIATDAPHNQMHVAIGGRDRYVVGRNMKMSDNNMHGSLGHVPYGSLGNITHGTLSLKKSSINQSKQSSVSAYQSQFTIQNVSHSPNPIKMYFPKTSYVDQFGSISRRFPLHSLPEDDVPSSCAEASPSSSFQVYIGSDVRRHPAPHLTNSEGHPMNSSPPENRRHGNISKHSQRMCKVSCTLLLVSNLIFVIIVASFMFNGSQSLISLS